MTLGLGRQKEAPGSLTRTLASDSAVFLREPWVGAAARWSTVARRESSEDGVAVSADGEAVVVDRVPAGHGLLLAEADVLPADGCRPVVENDGGDGERVAAAHPVGDVTFKGEPQSRDPLAGAFAVGWGARVREVVLVDLTSGVVGVLSFAEPAGQVP